MLPFLPVRKRIDDFSLRFHLLNSARHMAVQEGMWRGYFNEEKLLHNARLATGLNNYGDESFRINLRIHLERLKSRNFNLYGAKQAYVDTLTVLKNRLGAEAWFGKFPEILQREVTAPIVVVGLARSGTTRLHRMLAVDDRFSHLRNWESIFPIPWRLSYQSKLNGTPDPRISVAASLRSGWDESMGAVHPATIMDPEEESYFLNHSFARPSGYLTVADAPEQPPPELVAYAYMVKLLKLISWFRDDNECQPWVLKSPWHVFDLDSLIQTIPDAKLIFIHRDPIKVVASTCSLFWHFGADRMVSRDPILLGRACVDNADVQCQKMIRVRESMVPQAQQLDILYSDMEKNWSSVMQRIYEFIGMDYTSDTSLRLANWLEKSNNEKRTHNYSLSNFGLDAGEIDEKLFYYRKRFQIPYEQRA